MGSIIECKRRGCRPFFYAIHNFWLYLLAGEYPIHVVCTWLGNKVSIAQKHYLQVTERTLQKSGAKSGVVPARNDGKRSENATRARITSSVNSRAYRSLPVYAS